MKRLNLFLLLTLVSVLTFAQSVQLTAPGAKLEKACDNFGFTEGPAVAKDGKIYFSDQNNDRIYVWDEYNGCSLWLQGTNRANGMIFDKKGNLWVCAELHNELGYYDKNKKYHVVASGFDGKLLNGPNDVWITKNGEYFTDPYWQRSFWPKDRVQEQDVKGVYFVNKKGEIKRVVNDFKVPNGIIGTPDGKTLYIADMGDRKTWKYKIQPNGDLTDKTLFVQSGSDGVTMDKQGDLYLCSGRSVSIYSPAGELLQKIDVPEIPANVNFGGKNRDILFITARTSVYTIKMNVKGMY